MGNSSSSSSRSHQDETVDFGFLTPQGVYTGPRDWNQTIVTQLICQRKLAPFYRPLEDYDESWTDEQILAARKEPQDPEASPDSSRNDSPQPTHSGTSKSSHNKRQSSLKDPSKPEAAIYRGAVECPICFLYYPPNINHSRCCDQAICTECFVQIKRSEPTTTHLVSEPAACPYCVQENFGIVYSPPPWRSGIGGDGSNFPWADSPKASQQSLAHKRRQKSFGADSPEVVTIDQIRPDWEAKLAAVRAAVTRRANRRIIMRQVGDRLIPVGVTSGRVHALSPEEAAVSDSSEGNGSRRSRRRQQAPEHPFGQYLGPDLEELMVMEAMRLSLLEHEEQQRKEAEEKKKKEKEAKTDASPDESGAGPSNTGSSSSVPTVSSTESTSTRSRDSLQPQQQSSASRSPSPAAGARTGPPNGIPDTSVSMPTASYEQLPSSLSSEGSHPLIVKLVTTTGNESSEEAGYVVSGMSGVN
ncbi:zf-c3hc4 type zinc finger [Moniliophthora roreri MCA 2997]|uniref:Zf-c3hc4 type zinc finger n=1 Tax=Moniliophthora roreri (strain MCA 2997) TaxID=1381753 RepID=V2XH25_MONRO|nr:zf-c3hc4 type zinc finger [Moniliophthora roreri MCA 2997]